LKLGTVALDGTKVHANASRHSALSYGVTTAYYLSKRGHDIMVIDRKGGAARETSFANGALLTPSMPEPWNAPGCWRMLLTSLGRSDSTMQIRLRALPGLIEWGAKFLSNSRPALYERNTLSNLHLALHSLEVMKSLRQEISIEYGRSPRGSLRVFRTEAALAQASDVASRRLSLVA
jgi:D-amino-acid dehydrogenase